MERQLPIIAASIKQVNDHSQNRGKVRIPRYIAIIRDSRFLMAAAPLLPRCYEVLYSQQILYEIHPGRRSGLKIDYRNYNFKQIQKQACTINSSNLSILPGGSSSFQIIPKFPGSFWSRNVRPGVIIAACASSCLAYVETSPLALIPPFHPGIVLFHSEFILWLLSLS